MVSLNPHCTGITRYPRIKHRYYLNISAKSDKGQGNTSLANTYYNLDSVFATVPRIIQGHSKQHTTLAQISVLTEFTFESQEVHKVNRQSHSCIFTHTHVHIRGFREWQHHEKNTVRRGHRKYWVALPMLVAFWPQCPQQ